MKKFFIFAASALALMACAKTEELIVDPTENAADEGIKFEVYTQRGLSTKAGTPGDITNANIWNQDGYGFGVFAYYTAGEKYDNNAKPNFMYNQQVYKENATSTVWKYEPVKYWPNEYGDAAQSDETDYVTFFAYAPWTDIEPTTGIVVKGEKTKNIVSVNKNNATGDPIIKYVVDTDPKSSVDLLWGVAAENAGSKYSAIDPAYNGTNDLIVPGKPFIDLMKPGNPKEDKLSFNLKHSLAKVKFTIDYVKDDFTPQGAYMYDKDKTNVIDSTETRIFVRSFSVSGWATKGALNLNNTVAGQPLWKDFDGVKDLTFNDLTFNDGRKDGKEGDQNGAQTNEENQGLNPKIIENWAAMAVNGEKTVFGAKKNIGVAFYPQLLFGGDEKKNGGYFYVIPRNEPGNSVDVTIVYDVETIDPALAGLLSNGETHGSTIENVISKKHILGEGKDFEAGKQYWVKIHVGMTSVKVEAVVTDWVPTNDEDVDLPDNQPMPCWTVEGVPGYFTSDPVEGIEVPASAIKVIANETDWNTSAASGVLGRYYAWCDNGGTAPYKEDLWNTVANRAANINDARMAEAGESADGDGRFLDAQGYFDYVNCVRNWKGAINAPGAKWPWVCIDCQVMPVLGKLYLVYDGQEYLIKDYGTNVKGNYVCASIPAATGNDQMVIPGNGSDPAVVVDPTKVSVKFYTETSVKHETVY